MSQVNFIDFVPCLHGYLANAARSAKRRWRLFSTDRSGAETTYPAALQRCKLDAPLLAAGVLTGYGKDWRHPKKGRLTEFESKNPKCVLLFDEIEKAHITVIRVFLQILDDGICEDQYNERSVSFKNAIIFLQPMQANSIEEEIENGKKE